MVRRREDTAFMGGAHVFPGGRVDAADGDADAAWCDGLAHAAKQLEALPPAQAIAYHVAAARELFEEAGVLLAQASGAATTSRSRMRPINSGSNRIEPASTKRRRRCAR